MRGRRVTLFTNKNLNQIQKRTTITKKKPFFGAPEKNFDTIELAGTKDLLNLNFKPKSHNNNDYNNQNVLNKEGLFVWGASVLQTDEIPTEILLNGETVEDISLGDSITIIVTNSSENGRKIKYMGKYGFLSDEITENFTEINQLPNNLNLLSPLFCNAGRFHALLLENEEGKVYGMGSNADGQLGVDPKLLNQTFDFIPIEIPEKIQRVITSYSTSFALSKSGNLYWWGRSFNEIIGLGVGEDHIPFTPKKFSIPNIKLIASSLYHSVVVDQDNKIFVWGKNSDSQIAHKKLRFFQSPKEFHFQFTDKIIDISCGVRHNLLLTEKNEVYSWGGGESGQIGRPFSPLDCHDPKRIPSFENMNVVKIHAGETHNLLVTRNENGEESLWSWGNGSDNQLGFSDRATKGTPTLLKTLPSSLYFFKIYAGFYNSAVVVKSK